MAGSELTPAFEGLLFNLLQASLYGGAALMLLLLAARYLPAAVECWLLRLSALKLLAMVMLPIAVALPLLPANQQPVNHSHNSNQLAKLSNANDSPAVLQRTDESPSINALNGNASFEVRQLVPETKPVASEKIPPAFADTTQATAMPIQSAESTATQEARGESSSWRLWSMLIGAVWLLGMAVQSMRLLMGWQNAHRIYVGSKPLVDAKLQAFTYQNAQRLGLLRAPRLMTFDGDGGPRLYGTWRPVILLPASRLRRYTDVEARLVICHELAHAVRRDLLWNWIGSIAFVVFFFHPVIWWMKKRLEVAQEVACDRMVLERYRSNSADYARLLLKLVLTQKRSIPYGIAELHISGRKGILEERIMAVRDFATRAGRQRALMIIAAACAIALLLPWKLVAGTQEETKPETTKPTQETTEDGSVIVQGHSTKIDSTSGQVESSSKVVVRGFGQSDGKSDTSDSSARTIQGQSSTGGRVTSPGQSSTVRSTGGSTSFSNSVSSSGGSATTGSITSSGFSRGTGTTIRSTSPDTKSSSRSTVSLAFSDDESSLTIKQSDGKFEVVQSKTVDGELQRKEYAFGNAEEFKAKLPEAYKKYVEATSKSAASPKPPSRVATATTSSGGGELNPAQQTLLKELLKMKEENASDPQLSAVIQQMIDGLKRSGTEESKKIK